MAVNPTINITSTIGSAVVSVAFNSTLATVGLNQISNVQNVGTNEELLVMGDVAFPSGPVIVVNLASTSDETPNVLTLSLDEAGSDVIAVLRPGDLPLITSGLAASIWGAFSAAEGQAQVIAVER